MSEEGIKRLIVSAKTKIDDFLNLNSLNFQYVYGGATGDELEVRRKQHIDKKETPYECNDDSWIIYEITSLKIPKCTTIIEKYKKTDDIIEQYLINKLYNKYREKSVNDKTENGSISQTGGRGLNEKGGKTMKFYILYKLIENNKSQKSQKNQKNNIYI